MIYEHLFQKLVIAVIVAVIGMVLWGVVATQTLFELIILLILVRGWWLLWQWRYQPPTETEWEEVSANIAQSLLPEHVEHDPAGISQALDEVLDSPAYRERMEKLRKQAHPRDHRDIASEAVNLVLVLPASILVGLMLSSNIVTLNGLSRWTAVGSGAAGLALHFGAAFIPREKIRRRIIFRATVAGVVLLGTTGLAIGKHPYLFKFGVERHRMLAERDIALIPSVESSRHADLLFTYARDLEAEGRLSEAADLYERGLVMTPRDADAHRQAADIYVKMGREDLAERHRKMAAYTVPKVGTLWVVQSQVRPLPVFNPHPHQPFTICLVPMGDVPDGVLNWMGAEIQARLKVPVTRFGKSFPLPPSGRKNGLLGGEQWRPEALWTAFATSVKTLPILPIQYIIVTPVDLYLENSNYVFAVGFSVDACVSYARFHNLSEAEAAKDAVLIDRLVKNTLSCSIKALGVPGSADPNCVTAYCQSLPELDVKAPTPSPETDQLYREAIRKYEERRWAGKQ